MVWLSAASYAQPIEHCPLLSHDARGHLPLGRRGVAQQRRSKPGNYRIHPRRSAHRGQRVVAMAQAALACSLACGPTRPKRAQFVPTLALLDTRPNQRHTRTHPFAVETGPLAHPRLLVPPTTQRKLSAQLKEDPVGRPSSRPKALARSARPRPSHPSEGGAPARFAPVVILAHLRCAADHADVDPLGPALPSHARMPRPDTKDNASKLGPGPRAHEAESLAVSHPSNKAPILTRTRLASVVGARLI